jgi:hypothetical protein
MFSALTGAVLVGASGTSFWYFLPRNGQVHPLAKKPFLDSMITITIMTMLVMGIGLLGEGFFG